MRSEQQKQPHLEGVRGAFDALQFKIDQTIVESQQSRGGEVPVEYTGEAGSLSCVNGAIFQVDS